MAIIIKDLIEVFSNEQLQGRITKLAQEISKDYKDQRVVAICILKGAMYFFTDLTKQIQIKELIVDCMKVSSYGSDIKSSGTIKFELDNSVDIKDQHVLIIEDIIDTGRTMAALSQHFYQKGAKTVEICALIDKKECREKAIEVKYKGFDLSKGFIVGYGLDFDDKYRNLDTIYEAVIEES